MLIHRMTSSLDIDDKNIWPSHNKKISLVLVEMCHMLKWVDILHFTKFLSIFTFQTELL